MISPPAFTLGYRPALDGVRAIAILAVLARHSGWLSGGYVGVDVFFALSGFLITALLLEEHARTGTIRLRLFYARRGLRLLPALILFVAACEVVQLATAPPEFRPLLMRQGAAVLLYVANLTWVVDLPMGLFTHAWSLAIEEQFYLLWPVTLMALLRVVRSRVAIMVLLLAGAGAVCVHRVTLGLRGGLLMRLYGGPDAHADSLLIGCAVTLLLGWGALTRATGAARTVVRVGGVVGVLTLVVVLTKATFPFHYVLYQVSAITGLAAALMIIDVCVPGSWLARGLEQPALVGLGRISYGVYLWHFPIFVWLGALSVNGEVHPLGTVLSAWAVTLAVAVASYYVVERPALTLKQHYAAPREAS